MELSFEALRKIQLQERNFGALSALQDDFYEAYSLWVLEQQRALKADFSIERMKAYENSKKILEEIRQKREQKILLKALKDYRNDTVSSDGLAKEEKALYLASISSLKEFEETAAAAINPEKPKTPAIPVEIQPSTTPQTAEPAADVLKVKLLLDIPQFVGIDGTAYGPYADGEVAAIKREVAEILVRKNAAEPYDERAEAAKAISETVEKMDLNGVTRESG